MPTPDEIPEVTVVELKTKAIKGASANIIAQFVSISCQTVGVIILARLLNPSDFGLVAMVTAFSVWLSNFGVNGFTEYIIQKQGIVKEEVASIYWSHLLIATVIAIAFVFFGFVLVRMNHEPALSGISAALAIGFILQALSTSHIALLKREMKFAPIAISETAGTILSILLAILAAAAGMGYWAVVIRQLTTPVVMVLASRILYPWRPARPKRLGQALPALKYTVQVYANVSLGFLMRGLDKVLLGKYYGAQLLGNYDRAYYIFSMPAEQFLTPLHNVALATLSRLKGDWERFTEYFSKAVSLIAFPGVLSALVITLTAHDLVRLLLGENWNEAGRVVVAFGPGIAAQLIYGTHSWLHLSLGTPHRWLRWNIVAAVVTVIAFIIAAPFGAVAMAAAYSLRTFILILPSLWYAGHPIRLSVKRVIRSLWPYLVSGVTVGGAWLILIKHWPFMKELWGGVGPLLRIISVLCLGTALYVGLVAILERSFRSVREVISLLPHIFARTRV